MNKIQENKNIVKGDYYQINNTGYYQKHPSVAVHYHQQNLSSSLIKSSQQLNPQKYENKHHQILKSPFLQGCKKIMQKQEVNSVHEQDPLSQTKIKNDSILSEKRQKNNKMRRSSQNQINFKKGILKRSLIDSKQQANSQYNQVNIGIKNNMDRSVRIITDKYNQQSEKDKIYNSAAQRYRSNSSQIEQQQNNLLRSYIPKYPLQHFSSLETHKSKTARPSRQNFENNAKIKRQHTQGKQTVAMSPNNYRKYQEQFQQNNVEFQLQIYEKMDFLKQKLNYLQNQFKQSQNRVKNYEIQHELKIKQKQIQKIQKENEYLKQQKKCVDNSLKNQLNIQAHFQPLKKLIESKTYFILSFLIVMLICMMLGKSNQCSKS